MGAVITGMHAQGFDIELKLSGETWRATFYPSGLGHSIIYGTSDSPAPWIVVRRAAWKALNDPRMAA